MGVGRNNQHITWKAYMYEFLQHVDQIQIQSILWFYLKSGIVCMEFLMLCTHKEVLRILKATGVLVITPVYWCILYSWMKEEIAKHTICQAYMYMYVLSGCIDQGIQ